MIDDLIEEQENIAKEIRRIISNFGKDSDVRKTKSYYEKRLKNLQENWEKFLQKDGQITLDPDAPKDHEYFKENHFRSIETIYNQYRDKFVDEIKRLTDNEANPQPLVSLVATDSDEEITRLMRRQSGILNSLQRLFDSLVMDNQSNQYFEMKYSVISQYWAQASEIHHAIWGLIDDPTDVDYDQQRFITFEEQTQKILIRLREKGSESAEANSSNNNNNNGIGSTLMRLPQITIPQFDGEYLKWSQFHDLFTEMVHKQPMASCQKLWYLKSNVTGEAERLIRHLSPSDDNYDIAWTTLCDRYANRRLQVAALLNKLLSQSSQSAEGASSNAIKALHDTTRECLMGLKNLKVKTDNWDPILLHVLLKKLDKSTHALYEQQLRNPKDLQSMEEFLRFLENRFQSLESLGAKGRPTERDSGIKKFATHRQITTVATTTSHKTCVACKEAHQLFQCKKFLKMNQSERLNLTKKHKLCINCLKTGHGVAQCSSRTCTKCNKRHNTLLHIEGKTSYNDSSPHQPLSSTNNQDSRINDHPQTSNLAAARQLNEQPSTAATVKGDYQKGYILLGTAKIKLSASNGRTIECRALLDSGSMSNFVSERVLRKLNVSPQTGNSTIEGIGGTMQKSDKRINLILQSRINNFTVRLESTVLARITSPQPTRKLDISNWKIPKNIQMADPDFNSPEHIDCLIGMEHYFDLMSIGQIKLDDNLPMLQNTVLGWVVGGKVYDPSPDVLTCGINYEVDNLNETIEKFWKIEELDEPQSNLTPAEKRCEKYFKETVKTNNEGRFVVKIPFTNNPTELGESKDIALRRFFSLERKLSKDPELRQQYVKFMEEYLQLGHMEPIDFRTIQSPYYFLPHHCVLKPDSSTTKLRVVFDASAKTTSNVSLNNIMAAGPTIQDDLFTILLRFRMPRFVFTADIQKMYRQILVDESERKFQLILWRNNPDETLKTYQLCTVTYGTTSAPYLSIKCLQTLAEETEQSHPLGSKALATDCYVDDIMTGSDRLVTAREMQTQLRDLLQLRGFKLRKWCANHPRLLQEIPSEDQEVCIDFNDQNEEYIKTLGLTWLPKTDQFGIKIHKHDSQRITKRYLASNIARLFDPLGIMAPVIVAAKMMLQQLWKLNLDWDAAIPIELHSRWTTFQDGLETLEKVQFPRHVFDHKTSKSRQIHVFCDASERAYGAAIYVRSKNTDSSTTVHLLCSKSRVAPLKQVNLPRLELCAAKLAAELAHRVIKDIRDENAPVFFWTDSEIVLNWINSESTSFHTFVANRIAQIQRLSEPKQWRHVRSKDNPADVVSRGIPPEKLKACTIWFYGPAFLYGDESLWPTPFVKTSVGVLEQKKTVTTATTTATKDDNDQLIACINHKKSIRKLQRIIAYVLRFINRTRNPAEVPPSRALTPKELDQSLTIIIKQAQESEFMDDLHHLTNFKEVSKRSSLATLTPFLDEKGMLRVGGRLEASSLSFNAKHPVLLPYSHPLTKLIMSEIHQDNRHVGPQTLLSLTRQRYWPIKGKTIARSIVQNCVKCARAQPKLLTQIMGQLPARRVQPSRPFINSGVDFCGPIWIHYRLRGKRPQKSYIAVFCCFATKAVHFEVVSDLTTDAFIGALKRFISRRGHCQHLHCDNATNFVGARNQLEELKDSIYSEEAKDTICHFCSTKGIQFNFIPPRAPHFGGLWEAAVKSAKHLMLRSVASASLTYEELETVIVEIEAILNSRPLTAMSEDPNDLAVLTPGHFLIGEPLTAPVDPNSTEEKSSLSTRWKLVTHIKNTFWQRWSNEYLHELQHRYKWKQRKDNVQPGTVVVIKEDNTPVMKWPLGRIVQTFEGDDGCVRVADVKTASGTFRRPIHRLAPLPIDDEVQQTNTQKRSIESPAKDSNSPHQNTPETESPLSAKRKRVSAISSLLHVLLALCIVLPSATGQSITVTQFDHKPGLHFEGIGSIRLISDEWHLLVYYDLNPYWTEFTALSSGIKLIGSLCEHFEEKATCTTIIVQFEHVLNELMDDNELLSSRPTTKRTRRGALNVVGNVANSLFGILDSNYARQMSNTINKVNMNQAHLVEVLKNQTSIIDSTVNVMKREQSAVARKFQTLDREFKRIMETFNQTNELTFQMRNQQVFTTTSIQLTLLLSNLQRIQAQIMAVLTDMHQGNINPALLSPKQLVNEITTIRNHLPPGLQLPLFEDENIAQLYKLMTTEGRLIDKHLIFRIKVPLLSLDKFDLCKIFPIPARANSTLVSIIPQYEFLAVDRYRDQFYSITEQELSKCSTAMTTEQTHLCERKQPIYRKGSQLRSCEIDFFSGISNSPNCKTSKINNSPIWIQLNHPNRWIFAVKSETRLTCVCDQITSTMTITGSGMMTIAPSCIIKHDLMTIQGHHIYPSDTKTSYSTLGTFTEIATLKKFSPTLSVSGQFKTRPDELDAILEQLVAQSIDLPEETEARHIQNLSVSYSGLILAIIVAIIIISKCIRKRVGNRRIEVQQQAPIPAPRARSLRNLNLDIDVGL